MRRARRTLHGVLWLIAALASGCAAPGTVRKAPHEVTERARAATPEPGMALVFIVRPSGEADPVHMPVTCDGAALGTTGGRRFLVTSVAPGLHVFASSAKDTSEVPVRLEAGTTYYFEQQPVMGFFGTFCRLVRIPDEDGRVKLRKCSLSAEMAPRPAARGAR